MIGTSIGRYHIEEELGHGGMSVVYRGRDHELGRDVAVKVLHAHLAKKAENRKRFHREAQAIARLRHENILEIYDYASQDAERAYIIMEYVDGSNLRQFLEQHGPPPPEHCALIGLAICHALEIAHAKGIIHRDLKPENVMISKNGRVKLMDFGIAHVFDAETMTQTGSLLGSPAHMAPEMIEGDPVDERADIFALGTVLYWLATGALPFEGKNTPQVLKRVLEGIYRNPESHDDRIGECFSNIIRTSLAFEPSERYANVDAIARELESFILSAKIEDMSAELKHYLKDPEARASTFTDELVGGAHDARHARARRPRSSSGVSPLQPHPRLRTSQRRGSGEDRGSPHTPIPSHPRHRSRHRGARHRGDLGDDGRRSGPSNGRGQDLGAHQ